MRQPLRVLMVGSSKDTTRLVVDQLQKGGYDPKYRQVNTNEQMQKALDGEVWDLVISDHGTDSFCTLDALAVANNNNLDVPFAVVANTKDHEHVNASIKAGVCEYLSFEEMSLLVPLVQRDLQQAQIRREYRRIEEALQKCEASYRLILNTEPSATLIIDSETNQLLDANRTAEKLYGYSRIELLEMNYANLSAQPEDTIEQIKTLVARTPIQPTPGLAQQLHRKRDGTKFDVEISHGVSNTGKQKYILAIINDISDRKRMEEQFLTLQKKELLGRLAGYIAHDFNNLLGIIIGYSHLVLWELEQTSPMHNEIEEISKAAHRAADLTRQLLAFSRKETLQAKVVDINELVRNIEPMLRRLIGEHVELDVDLYPEPIQANVDPELMEQVIMNISIDARDTMPKGGKIAIETRSANLDQAAIDQIGQGAPGFYASFAISHAVHNGQEDAKAHEQETNHADKPKVDGLGLSMAQDIIRKSHGYLVVEHRDTKGSALRVYLPKAKRTTPEHCERNIPKRGTETVLVVEDDELLLELIDRMLSLCGYNVLCARQGNEALQLAERHMGDIHLLLTDVIMPHMSGADLAASLKALKPKLNILFMSGYSNEAIDHHGVSEDDTPIIQKPFTLDKLSIIVRSVLDQNGCSSY